MKTFGSYLPCWYTVGDLESQIQDLHEANETASAEVLRLDQENQMLTGHIKRLSANLDNDTAAERLILQQQVYIYLDVVIKIRT